MTKLKEHLKLETVKQSEKLQGIECEKYHLIRHNYIGEDVTFDSPILTKEQIEKYDCGGSFLEEGSETPAPTIYDVIDSNLLSDENKRKVLDQCIGGWRVETIGNWILKNLK